MSKILIKKDIKYICITFLSELHPLFNSKNIRLHQTNKDLKSWFYRLNRVGAFWTAINVYNKGNFVIQLTPSNFWNKINVL